MKIYFVAADYSGSSWYRIVQPAGLSKHLYEKVLWTLPRQINYQFLTECDMIVVQRQFHDKAVGMTKQLKARNKIVVSEIDDNLWSVPADSYLKKLWNEKALKGLEEHLRVSDAVTVSTPTLQRIVKQFNPNVFLVPNLVVFNKEFKKAENPDGKIRIGWAGSDTHIEDFTEEVQNALLDIKSKYGDRVDICCFGAVPNKLMFHVSYYQFVLPHYYLTFLHSLGIDIGIVPNRENSFNDARSNLKYVEYSSIKAATIASKVQAYTTTIQSGTNGILVKKNSYIAWFKALRDLIEDAAMRKEMAEKAFDYCYRHYSVQERREQYKIYYEILNRVQGG